MKAKCIPLAYAVLMAAGVAAAVGVGLSSMAGMRAMGASGKSLPSKPAARNGAGAGATGVAVLTPEVRQELLRTLKEVAAFDAIEPVSMSSYPISPLSSADRADDNPAPPPASDHKVSGVVMSVKGRGTALIDDRVQQEGDVLADGSRVQSIRPGKVVLVGPSGVVSRYAVTQGFTPSKPAQPGKEQP